MRPLRETWRSRFEARSEAAAQPDEQALARVDELLARDLEDACPLPPARLAPNIRRALRDARRPGGRALRALALAAAVALAIFSLSFQESRRPEKLPSAPAPQRFLALQFDLERLMSTPATQWRAAVEAPLLTEARLLADDGERVARALVASLPSPLRRNLPLWRQATSPHLR